MSTDSDDLVAFTMRQVAGRLALSEVMIRDLVRSGALPSFKIGRSVRIRAVDLRQFIEAAPRPRAKQQ
jgi:putative molybdopterin biosynthesis protein